MKGADRIASVNNPKGVQPTKGEAEGIYEFEAADGQRLTHHLFRFPAKFHPPVVRQLLIDYTKPGHRVYDPFCGSGTLMVEASVAGRNSVGSDVDPLSVFVSATKIHPIPANRLERTRDQLLETITPIRRSTKEYDELRAGDIDDATFARELGECWVPAIPNLGHWFFRYVTVDLSRLLRAIDEIDVPHTHRQLLRLVFAATIRAASRADPVPVSGLEVTRVMLKKEEAGRRIDVFSLFEKRLSRAISDMRSYQEARDATSVSSAHLADATRLPKNIAAAVDAVITSPPYHGAVDYYRRHKLEMFWLGYTVDQIQRLHLLRKYLGRPKVPQQHEFVRSLQLQPREVVGIEEKIREVSSERADAFRHYAVGMALAFKGLASRMVPHCPLVLVVGHSSWNGAEIDTSSLMAAVAKPWYELDETHWYPVKNRYMSYGRHNSANIDREYVLVLRRTRKQR